ncbi:hypothetical protein ACOSQ2_006568 [Xanthoceras sorbifolium]
MVDKSSHIKQRKLRSDVWSHFEKYKDEDEKDWARCNLCNKDFDGSSRSGTTHLRNHFKSCQRKKRGGGGAKSAEAAIAIKEKTVMDQQLSHLDMTRMIIKQRITSQISINAADIMDVYYQEKEKLRKYFEKLSCRFSLTIDKVEFRDKCAYLMVCFIDDDWKLKKKIISFEHIEDNQNFGKALKNMLLEWGIENNISSMIKFQTIYHDKCVISSNEREKWFSGQVLRVESIDYICDKVLDNIRRSHDNCINKLFSYIRKTSSQNGNFQIAIERVKSLGKEVTAEVIPTKQELKLKWEYWCNTAGLSKIALGLREAFFELEDMDPDFKSINLTKEQWDQVTALHNCYEDLIDTAFLNHWRNYQTANMYFPMICSLYTKSLLLAKHKVWFNQVECYGLGFKSKADKYWCEYKLVLAVAAVLDPWFKMNIVKHWYIKIYGGECEAQGANNFKSCTSGSQQTNSFIPYKMVDLSGKMCKSSHDPNNIQSLDSELHLYLKKVKSPLIENFDILRWWRDNTQNFLMLAKMARNFLSIQISQLSYDERCEMRLRSQLCMRTWILAWSERLTYAQKAGWGCKI